jgi:hypothetical protein
MGHDGTRCFNRSVPDTLPRAGVPGRRTRLATDSRLHIAARLQGGRLVPAHAEQTQQTLGPRLGSPKALNAAARSMTAGTGHECPGSNDVEGHQAAELHDEVMAAFPRRSCCESGPQQSLGCDIDLTSDREVTSVGYWHNTETGHV